MASLLMIMGWCLFVGVLVLLRRRGTTMKIFIGVPIALLTVLLLAEKFGWFSFEWIQAHTNMLALIVASGFFVLLQYSPERTD